MRDFRDAKAMAHALREALQGRGMQTTHSESLELTAKAFGFDNWNILSARIEAARPHAVDPAASHAAPGPVLPPTLHCSFCGKSQHDVRKLIAGPSVFICDECVELCTDIVNDGMLWRVLSLLRAKPKHVDARQAAFALVRGLSAEELASYVEQSRQVVERGRLTLQFIDRRSQMRDGGAAPDEDATTLRLLGHLKTKTSDELAALQKNAQRELVHHEEALRIGTAVLEERGTQTNPG
jgi:hypothetical protein